MMRRNWSTDASLLLTAILCIPFFGWVLPNCKAFPWSDEWHYLAPMTSSGVPPLSWFFQQHVDHFIPLQKLVHFIALRAAHFDFRVLVAINFVTAALASVFFIAAANTYRGAGCIGDMFIPLGLLTLGTGFSLWGFGFQFLSSILFFSAFLLFAARGSLAKALFFLFLCTWTGLNGLLLSTWMSASIAAFAVIRRYPLDRASVALLLVTLVTNIALWIIWAPSSASGKHAESRRIN